MNKLVPGALWLPVLLGGLVWCWAADGAPVTGTSISKSHVDDFSKTLNLSKKLLKDSRILTHAYRLWKLPGSHLDFSESDQVFPSVSISISSWLKLQTGDRLRLLSQALDIYPVYLEHLEKWEKKQEEDEAPNLKAPVSNLHKGLLDLLGHINRQMASLGIDSPQTLTTHVPPADDNDWCNRVKMYRALRSLEQALFRAVREYTALMRRG